jgi:exodeoxyribonuclease V gamma subunit
VVSCLLEYLDKAFAAPNVVKKHCLQAFNAKYFMPGTGLFSFSKDNALAAKSLWAGPRPGQGRPVLTGEPEEQWRTVDLEGLLGFFRGPARFFLQRRLGVTLPREEEAVPDREPFTLSGLERYSLRQRVLSERLAGRGVEADLARYRAEGLLPHGVAGELTLRGLAHEVDAFLPLIARTMAGRRFEKTTLTVAVDGFTVTGSRTPSGIRVSSRTVLQMSPRRSPARMAQPAPAPGSVPGEAATGTHIHAKGVLELSPSPDPLAALRVLLAVYWQGLSRPVRFFPRSSYAYAEALKKYDSDERAMQAARRQWEEPSRERSEAGDAAAHLCFSGTDPLDDEFRALSRAVFGPVLKAMEA